MGNSTGNYTVVVDGQKFNVTVAEGDADIKITPVAADAAPATAGVTAAPSETGASVDAAVNGNVWKILVKEGDVVEKDQPIMILEAMKMEIDINAPVSGTITSITVDPNQAVEEGQQLATIG